MKKRLLIISTMKGFSWGGSEELWYEAAEQAMADGYEVEVIVLQNEPLHAKLIALQQKLPLTIIAGRQIVLPALWKRVLFKLIGKVLPIKETDRFAFLNERSYDVLLVNQGSAVDIAQMPDLARFLQHTQLPYVIVNHLVSDDMFLNDAQRILLQQLFVKAKKLCFVSAQNRNEFERKLLLSMKDAVLVKNPVNLQKKEILAWPASDTATMAVVARLDANHKGHDLLLAVLQQPQWRERNYKLNIYGTGPDEAYLQGLISFYALENKVELKGYCSDIKTVWRQNQLLLLTSRTEGLPLTIIEAMLCGRAVVTTNVGDSAVLVEEGKNGWVAESPTLQHISNALENAWQARAQWKQAGVAAYEKATAFVDPQPGKTLLQLIDA